MLAPFLSGAMSLGFWGASLFFLRFWKKTGDRFFAMFSLSFLLLAVERLALAFMDQENEVRTYVYLFRLIAFVLILLAILDKNYFAGRRR